MNHKAKQREAAAAKDSLWYKQGVIYQCHVRAFCDSNGDGIGDFPGLTSKLGYLRELGVSAVWLLPFYPSPLRDDGYDIADYYSINPSYGTLADFKTFLREAHRLGLRVITELVINHTSDRHPWFQRARRAPPDSRYRNYYVWSRDNRKYKEARIIFKDFEDSNWSWDPLANAYYWHRFYSHQPDLNFENPEVHREIFRILDFWLDLGVDGLRLDAIPYLYEEEGTNCENLPQTHAFLKKLRRRVDEKYGDRMLIAEANQWPEDAVAYFGEGKGDECHVAFHFPVMPRLFMALKMEDRIPIMDILEQTPSIPETSQWAIFLRNHDELTLEMVTDEERDYMYRMYAHDPKARINLGIRRRLAPLLGNDRRRMELLNALLFSLPGTPIIYYGDEIGMGDNVFLGDRNGVRTPMQWSSDKNAGFSRANPQSLFLPIVVDPEYHYESLNVEAQQANPHSLLWWMKRLIAARKRWLAFGQGSVEFLHPENRKVLAYIRRHENETILAVANMSRFVQPVELDLAAYANHRPMEIFGRTPFPDIGEEPYFLTLGPHSFYWFSLAPAAKPNGNGRSTALDQETRVLRFKDRWEEILRQPAERARLEIILQEYLPQKRWFRGKAKPIKGVAVTESIPLSQKGNAPRLLLIRVDYVQDEPETYLLPMAMQPMDEETGKIPPLAIARVSFQNGRQGFLHDASASQEVARILLEAIVRKKTFPGDNGELAAFPTPHLRAMRNETGSLLPSPHQAEQSNTAILYGDKLIMKLFRRVEEGINPDQEITSFLLAKKFSHMAPLAGALEWRTGDRGRKTTHSLGILSAFIPNCRDAWEHALDALGKYFEEIQSMMAEGAVDAPPPTHVFEFPPEGDEKKLDLLGPFAESARLLGDRTAALHRALISDPDNPDFAPEPFTPFYQRSFSQSMRNLAVRNLQLLRSRLPTLPEGTREEAESVLALESFILEQLKEITRHPIHTVRIRCHGDYHLGQVLHTGKDFIILDFEGEPARSLSERRIKRNALRDVAGMLRSMDYAAHQALSRHIEIGNAPPADKPRFLPWAKAWSDLAGSAFLSSYLEGTGKTDLVPDDENILHLLLRAHLLEKALYELGYELNNRPGWVPIPLMGLKSILSDFGTEG